jgi:hypothetical protein
MRVPIDEMKRIQKHPLHCRGFVYGQRRKNFAECMSIRATLVTVEYLRALVFVVSFCDLMIKNENMDETYSNQLVFNFFQRFTSN